MDWFIEIYGGEPEVRQKTIPFLTGDHMAIWIRKWIREGAKDRIRVHELASGTREEKEEIRRILSDANITIQFI